MDARCCMRRSLPAGRGRARSTRLGLFDRPEAIVLVEWPERPANDLLVTDCQAGDGRHPGGRQRPRRGDCDVRRRGAVLDRAARAVPRPAGGAHPRRHAAQRLGSQRARSGSATSPSSCRRGERDWALAELFAAQLGGAALLPDIRTFGGEHAEEEPFLPPSPAPPPPPVAGRLERRLTLSRLVRGFADRADGFASPPNAAEVLRLADSLGELVDDLIIEDVAIERLRELAPEELAAQLAGRRALPRRGAGRLAGDPQGPRQGGRGDGAQRPAAAAGGERGAGLWRPAGDCRRLDRLDPGDGGIDGRDRGAAARRAGAAGARHHAEPRTARDATHERSGPGTSAIRAAAAAAPARRGRCGGVEELGAAAPRTALVRAMLAPAGRDARLAGARAALPRWRRRSTGAAVLAARATPTVRGPGHRAWRRDGRSRRGAASASCRATRLWRDASRQSSSRHDIAVDDPAGTPLLPVGRRPAGAAGAGGGGQPATGRSTSWRCCATAR